MYMREKYGVEPTGICAKCRFFLTIKTPGQYKRHKCTAYVVLTGRTPEWRAHFTACGLYTRKEMDEAEAADDKR